MLCVRVEESPSNERTPRRDEDEPGGHGTHVVGALVGAAPAALGGAATSSPLYSSAMLLGDVATSDDLDGAGAGARAYDGQAPGARVAFFDVGDTATGALRLPDDLAR